MEKAPHQEEELVSLFDQLMGFVEKDEESIQLPNLPANLGQPEDIAKHNVLLVHEGEDEIETSIYMKEQKDSPILEVNENSLHEEVYQITK